MVVFAHYFAVQTLLDGLTCCRWHCQATLRQFTVTLFASVVTCAPPPAVTSNVLQGHLKMKHFVFKLLKSRPMAASLYFPPSNEFTFPEAIPDRERPTPRPPLGKVNRTRRAPVDCCCCSRCRFPELMAELASDQRRTSPRACDKPTARPGQAALHRALPPRLSPPRLTESLQGGFLTPPPPPPPLSAGSVELCSCSVIYTPPSAERSEELSGGLCCQGPLMGVNSQDGLRYQKHFTRSRTPPRPTFTPIRAG